MLRGGISRKAAKDAKGRDGTCSSAAHLVLEGSSEDDKASSIFS